MIFSSENLLQDSSSRSFGFFSFSVLKTLLLLLLLIIIVRQEDVQTQLKTKVVWGCMMIYLKKIAKPIIGNVKKPGSAVDSVGWPGHGSIGLTDRVNFDDVNNLLYILNICINIYTI